MLLKNERAALPLTGEAEADRGDRAACRQPCGSDGLVGHGRKTRRRRDTTRSLRKKYGADRITHVPVLKNSRDTSRDQFEAAVAAAKGSDIALLFRGEEQILSGEARSRAFLDVPGAQESLVEEIAKQARRWSRSFLRDVRLRFMSGREVRRRPVCAGTPEPWEERRLWTCCRAMQALRDISHHVSTHGWPDPDLLRSAEHGTSGAAGLSGIPTGTPLDPQGYTSKYLDVENHA